ncbi:undecaprenyldiphospho-muramoylpentapeptide beta-N-acetylglucosaminyltransferase [Litoribacter alkaliphilus]|uniref:UDP-N-acetylglucosamine--N-acetylmuramyl-(pentapeptide) pyrophosphoryl-undecaprenol N-acetylglucosamine transferase n=2 Tax=Litoribacter ruber TaxID=702568 RepID=A0AAP2CG14_9BACT|nr:undecaprenyldiphospho-muramoylpentapeptide beta-N-acetylglucosaminyltransferase [Litoribacter alkaliphilus]
MISGGGTGGHIYPAIAIANAWMEKHPGSEILFVGAEGKMEMEKVPQAGYKIKGLKIAGLQRKLTLANLAFPFKVLASLQKAKKLVKDFNPDAVIGVGGYASGPVLYAAQGKGIPTLIQEQNSYAGLTNKILAKKANTICVAYPEMDKFFPSGKITYTGNPVRKDILSLEGKKDKGLENFGLEKGKPVILVLGGSLGARTINQSVLGALQQFDELGYQVLWQSGKFYFEEMSKAVEGSKFKNVKVLAFLKEMDLAYAAADIVISRAGALSVSELSLVGKPVIFVPSPNVAEDHQTKNAMAYVSQKAALMLADNVAVERLGETVANLIADKAEMALLGQNIKRLAKPEATNTIVEEIEQLIK